MTARTQPASVRVIGWLYEFTVQLADGTEHVYRIAARCQGAALERLLKKLEDMGIERHPLINYRRVEA